MSNRKIITRQRHEHSKSNGPAIGFFVIEEWSVVDSERWYERGELPTQEDGTEFEYRIRQQLQLMIDELFAIHQDMYSDQSIACPQTTWVEHNCPEIFDVLESKRMT